MVHACGAVKALRLLGGGVAPERSRRHSAQRVGPASCECGVGWGRIGGVVLMYIGSTTCGIVARKCGMLVFCRGTRGMG